MTLTLGVSADDLIFDDNERTTSGKTLDQELLRQLEMISHLSGRDIEAVKTVLESIIVRNRIEQILPFARDFTNQAGKINFLFNEICQAESVKGLRLDFLGHVLSTCSIGGHRVNVKESR